MWGIPRAVVIYVFTLSFTVQSEKGYESNKKESVNFYCSLLFVRKLVFVLG